MVALSSSRTEEARNQGMVTSIKQSEYSNTVLQKCEKVGQILDSCRLKDKERRYWLDKVKKSRRNQGQGKIGQRQPKWVELVDSSASPWTSLALTWIPMGFHSRSHQRQLNQSLGHNRRQTLSMQVGTGMKFSLISEEVMRS